MGRFITLSVGILLAGLLAVGCGGSSSGGGPVASTSGAATTTSGAATTTSGSTAAAPSSAPISPTVPTWTPAGTQVTSGPLFDLTPNYIANGGDPVFPPARYESDTFTDRNPHTVPTQLRLVVWNVEKGLDADAVERELTTIPELMTADFILLQECPRNDDKSDPPQINLARHLAQRLRMDYLFAVQWDFRFQRSGGGENGNAILSKYPLGNVEMIRSRPTANYWNIYARLGAPLVLAADAKIGDKFLRIYNTHLMVFDTGLGRDRQTTDLLADANAPGRSPYQVLAGDLNTWTHGANEAPVLQILADGWQHGLTPLPPYTQMGAGFLPQLLDFIFWRNLPSTTSGGVVTQAQAADHFPLYFDLAIR